jgi:pimeloyl-ACP methyl ester carboxylesterase
MLVFAHGWLANANLWRNVVDSLSSSFTCVTLDLPLGSHRLEMADRAALDPDGCGALIADALDALDAREATLIGNDSGGAYSQIALAQRPERVSRLVLTSCETPYDPFPPPPFDALPAAAASPEFLGELLAALRDRSVRRLPAAYGLLAKHPLDELVSDTYALPAVESQAVLRDVCKVMSTARAAPVHAAGEALIASFDRPVLLAWSPEDRVFPIAHARRYAAALADAAVCTIDDAYSFTPEDQPGALAAAIAAFAGG